jgi:dolichol-phosphate mannosyltransferase
MKVKSPEVSIVVPTLNESRNINRLVALLDKAMGAMDWEIIFVDDDSPDGTWQVAKAIARSDKRIRSIRRIDRRGLAGACIEGMLSSSAPYLAVMDADLQHDEKILPVMIAPLVSDEADLVIGTRMTKDKDHGFSAQRAEASRIANWLGRFALHTQISDPMSGFFTIKRSTFEDMAPLLTASGFKLLLDILATASPPLRIVEIPYSFRSRQDGMSKFDARRRWSKLREWLNPVGFSIPRLIGA